MTHEEERIESAAFEAFARGKRLLTGPLRLQGFLRIESLIALWHSHHDFVREGYRAEAREELGV